MTFTELLAAAYDDLNYQSAPAATVAARMKRWMNEGFQEVIRITKLTSLRDIDLPMNTVASQKTYGIQALERIDSMRNITNSTPLVKKTKQFIEEADPAETSSGSPSVWVPMGYHPVRVQPNSTGLWAASSDAADTVPTVKIRGVRANGELHSQVTTTLTGVTRVALGAITDYAAVTQFELSAACAGVISIYDAAVSGTELARIQIGSTSVMYLQFRLWPTPGAVYAMTIAGQLIVTDLVNDVSVYRMTPSFHALLLAFVRHKELWKKKDYAGSDREYAKFKIGCHEMAAEIEYGGDRPAATLEHSNLGPYFPADQ